MFAWCPVICASKVGLLLANMTGRPADLNFIQIYELTEDSIETDTEDFYKNVDEATRQCKICEVNIMQGDLNVNVGKGQK